MSKINRRKRGGRLDRGKGDACEVNEDMGNLKGL